MNEEVLLLYVEKNRMKIDNLFDLRTVLDKLHR